MSVMYMDEFVHQVGDYADAVKRVDPEQLAWSKKMYKRASDVFASARCDNEFVEVCVHPISGMKEDWCYCLRCSRSLGMMSLVLHYDICDLDQGVFDARIQVQLRFEEPDPEYPDDRIERGFLKIHSEDRRFYLYWYGKLFDADTKLRKSERAFLNEVAERARLEHRNFRGHVRVSQRNAFHLVRAFADQLNGKRRT